MGHGLLKQMIVTSTLGSHQKVSTTQFSCFFLFPVNPSIAVGHVLFDLQGLSIIIIIIIIIIQFFIINMMTQNPITSHDDECKILTISPFLE